MSDVFSRAAHRLWAARDVLARLPVMERWAEFGTPILVGAVAYGLVVAPDIDIEVYCDEPRIEDGFTILRDCALNPRVKKARFANELEGPDQGLYWQLRYLYADGQLWKIDMWSLRRDHPGPVARDLIEPMRQALTDERRQAILEIKEQVVARGLGYPSIQVYRAVIEAGARSIDEFEEWYRRDPVEGLTDWKPSHDPLKGATSVHTPSHH